MDSLFIDESTPSSISSVLGNLTIRVDLPHDDTPFMGAPTAFLTQLIHGTPYIPDTIWDIVATP
jgi:hypothetical protein